MARVKVHQGDKTKVNAKGVLVIKRSNGNVVKLNGPKGTIVRKKADGTVVKQKLTKSAKVGSIGKTLKSLFPVKPSKAKFALPSMIRASSKKAPSSTMRAR